MFLNLLLFKGKNNTNFLIVDNSFSNIFYIFLMDVFNLKFALKVIP